MKFIFITIFFLLSLQTYADRITNAYKQIQKGEFDKARDLLNKVLEKEPENAGALHVLAVYYFSDKNPRFDIDTAYNFVQKAIVFYKIANPKDVADWTKDGISPDAAQQLKVEIEAKAFENAQKTNSVLAFQNFLDKFPTASQIPQAIIYRNQLAWLVAEKLNSLESYVAFIQKYPEAEQIKEAEKRRDKIIFEEATKSGKLKSYEDFLEENPTNFYRENAIRKVFELGTAKHNKQTYTDFIKQFPESETAKLAYDWLLAVYLKEKNLADYLNQYPNATNKPASSKLLAVEKSDYLAVYENEAYHFIDQNGNKNIQKDFEEILKKYRCKAIDEAFIITFKNNYYGLMDKWGNEILKAEYDAIEFFNAGLFKITKNARQGLFQFTGREILPIQYDAIEAVNSHFIKFKKDRRWGLATFNGIIVLENQFTDIEKQGKHWLIFKNNNRYGLASNEMLFEKVAQRNQQINLEYNQVEILENDFAQVAQNDKFGVLDKSAKKIIPIEKQQIALIGKTGFASQKDDLWEIHDIDGTVNSDLKFSKMIHSSKFVAGKTDKKWGIIDLQGKIFKEFAFDSIAVMDETFFLYQNKPKKVTAEFTAGNTPVSVDFTAFKNFRVEKGAYPQAEIFIYYEALGLKGLFNQKGTKILSPKYNNVNPLDNDILNVQLNGKFGLVDSLSKLLVPIRYDGVSNLDSTGYKTLLLNRKFGIFNKNMKILIEPAYDVMPQIVKYDAQKPMFLCNKAGDLGLIDAKGKVLLPFQFQEIHLWIDSVALVKDDSDKWFLYDFSLKAKKLAELRKKEALKIKNPKDRKEEPAKITFDDIKFTKQTKEESIIIFKQNNQYGLLSNRKGTLAEAQFDVIENRGSNENPIFFAEKRQDNQYQISIFNALGKMIWSKLLGEDAYEAMICD